MTVLRRCFLEPIPAMEEAVSLLDLACDRIAVGKMGEARDLIRQADKPEVHRHAARVMGVYDDELHRYRRSGRAVEQLESAQKAAARRPTHAVESAIFRRDGHRCRYCGVRVMLSAARKAMMAIVPEALPWPESDAGKHSAFYALTAVADHVVPHAADGGTDAENLVTACQCCNYGKGALRLEQLDLIDPRLIPPVQDAWDGLSRVVGYRPSNSADRSAIGELALAQTQAVSAPRSARKAHVATPISLEEFAPRHAVRLRSVLESCEGLGLTWHCEKALQIRLTVNGVMVEIVGINADGTVEIPWALPAYKSEFRAFTNTLAAGIPDGVSYETPKWWRVNKNGRRLTVEELLEASEALLSAIRRFKIEVERL